MADSNVTPLRLRADLEDLARLAEYIDLFAEEQELRPKDAYALNLAAEELFANTVNHSLPPASFVEFSLTREDGLVDAVYIDDGSAFDPTAHATPDTTVSAAERSIGGLGIHFIRTSMEDFQYARQDGRNVVRFRRRLAV